MSEGIYSAAVSLVAIVTVLVLVLAQSKTLTSLSYIVVLFVIPFFAGVVGRQPFWYTCVPSLATVIACAVLMQPHDSTQEIVLADSLFIITNATVCTLIAAYTLEHGERKSWLLTQIERRQQEDLTVATRQLHTLSMLDPLTALYNRRQVEADYARIWAECKQDGTQIAMLIMDVDSFKLYNDHHRHPAGDRCLKQVAAVIAPPSLTRASLPGLAARSSASCCPTATSHKPCALASWSAMPSAGLKSNTGRRAWTHTSRSALLLMAVTFKPTSLSIFTVPEGLGLLRKAIAVTQKIRKQARTPLAIELRVAFGT